MFSGNWYILGAKSIAIGTIRALTMCHKECNIKGVIVSSKETNPDYVEGYKVEVLSELSQRLGSEEKANVNVLIATSIYLHSEIRGTLKNFGFVNIKELDSVTVSKLMEEYYTALGMFSSVKVCSKADEMTGDGMYRFNEKAVCPEMPKVTVLEVRHHSDQPMKYKCSNPSWVHGFQAGITGGKEPGNLNGSVSEYFDEKGENIAAKNNEYRELTGFYWAWKNLAESDDEYIGISRFRRFLDIEERDLIYCKEHSVDAILPLPMVNLPTVCDYHKRYTTEEEWNVFLRVVKEMAPDYYMDADRIWNSQYMYKFNMLIAKKAVFNDYCAWLFPILEKTESRLIEAGALRSRRCLDYFGEYLMTLYFMHNAYKLNIRHTGRILRP